MPLSKGTYAHAYANILPQKALAATELENEQFENKLKAPSRLPRVVARSIGSATPLGAVETMLQKDAGKTTDAGVDYSDVVKKLNYQQFKLDEWRQLQPLNEGNHDLAEMFPKGKEDEWNTLVLTTNGNLVSPQSFYDCMDSAETLTEKLLEETPNKITTVGRYYSPTFYPNNENEHEGAMHVDSSALSSIRRYRSVMKDCEGVDNMSPSSIAMGMDILDILTERDEAGNRVLEDGKPLMRSDAAEIMKHLVGYGYSGGYLTMKDSFRLVADFLSNGEAKIQVGHGENAIIRDSSKFFAHTILPKARLIGVAGMDPMNNDNRVSAPKEVNFVSSGDFSMALLGHGFSRKKQNLEVATPQVRDQRKALNSITGQQPLENKHGGHDQVSYVNALLHDKNHELCKKASELLTEKQLGR